MFDKGWYLIMEKRHKFGHRYDGWRISDEDPFINLLMYIMPERSDAHVLFQEDIDITKTMKYLYEKRRAGYKELKFYHIVYAAAVRVLAMKPKMNRFICGKKMYMRKNIEISMMALKSGDKEDIGSQDSSVKIRFDPKETLFEISEKTEKYIKESKESLDTSADALAKFINNAPGFVTGFVVGLLKFLDKRGWLPKAVINASPFHCSMYITNLGSLGINSIYHHIYNFGTTTIFAALGARKRKNVVNDDGTIKKMQYMDFKLAIDERCVNGFYNSGAIKLFIHYIMNPELLEKSDEVTGNV